MSCAADNTIILTNLETKEELSKWTTNGRLSPHIKDMHKSI